MTYKFNPAREARDIALQALLDEDGITLFARRIDPEGKLSRQAVYAWPRVPERWLGQVSKVYRVSRHALRPDLYARNGRKLNGRTRGH